MVKPETMALVNENSSPAVVVIPTDDADLDRAAIDSESDVEEDGGAGDAKIQAGPNKDDENEDKYFAAELSEARDRFFESTSVTRDNFDEKFTEIDLKLRTAACVVLDLEFSGLRLNNFSRPRILDTGADRYQRLRQVVQHFKPLQVGLAIVQDNSVPNDISTGGVAHVDVYSCFLNGGEANRILAVCAGGDKPDAVRAYPSVVFEQTAAEFLINNGFQIEDVFKYGIQYMNSDQEQRLRHILSDRRPMFAHLHYAGLFYAERYGDGPRELRACVARIKLWWMKKCERMARKRGSDLTGNNVDSGTFRVGGVQEKRQQLVASMATEGEDTEDSNKYRSKDAERLEFLCERLGKKWTADNMNDDTFVLQHSFTSLPSYLYLHEAIRTEFPYLWTAPVGSELSRILIFDRPLTAAEQKRNTVVVFNNAQRNRNVNTTGSITTTPGHNNALDELGEWAVQYCLGFTRLFRLIVSTCKRRQIPLVAHNCLADLLYFYQHFHKPLPDVYEQFKAELHRDLFPVVIDTKVLYKHYHSLLLATMPAYMKDERSNVELREIYLKVLELTTLQYPALRSVPVDFTDIRMVPKLASILAHNAAFDALMTSVVYIRLGRRMWIEAHKTVDDYTPNSPPFSPASAASGSVGPLSPSTVVKIDVNWRGIVALSEYVESMPNILNRVPLPFAALEHIHLDAVDPVSSRFSLAIIFHMKRAPMFMLQTDDESNMGKNAADLLAVQKPTVQLPVRVNTSNAIIGCDETQTDRRQRMCEIDIVTREEYVPLGDNRWLVLFSREDDYLRFRMRRRAEEIIESSVKVIDASDDAKDPVDAIDDDPFLITNVSNPLGGLQDRKKVTDVSNTEIVPPPPKRFKVSLDVSQSSIQVCELDDWVMKQLTLAKQEQVETELECPQKLNDMAKNRPFRQPFAEVKWLFVGSVIIAHCFAWRAALKAVFEF